MTICFNINAQHVGQFWNMKINAPFSHPTPGGVIWTKNIPDLNLSSPISLGIIPTRIQIPCIQKFSK